MCVAAENCFWQLNLQTLRSLARFLALDIPRTASLYKVCSSLIDGILGCTEDERMLFLRKWTLVEDPLTEELMDSADAAEVLAQDDRKELERTAIKAKRNKEEGIEFRKQYLSDRKAQAKARAKAAAKAHPGGGRGGAAGLLPGCAGPPMRPSRRKRCKPSRRLLAMSGAI